MLLRMTPLMLLPLAALTIACSGGPGTGNTGAGGEAGTNGAGGGATGSSAATGSSGSTGSGAGGAGGGTGSSSGSGGGTQKPAICPPGPFANDPLPADKNAKKVQGGFGFLEGPVWFADLNALFFSDLISQKPPNQPPLNGPAGTIHKFTPPSTFEVFIENGSTVGLAISPDGDILACTYDTRSISTINPKTKERKPLIENYMGKKFNSPNDVAARSDGNIYFSDPDWQLSGNMSSELPMAVYRRSPAGEISVIGTFDKPNGVAISPDENTLYVGAIDGKIRKYTLSPDGSTGAPADFANASGPDSFAMDCAGNLFVAGGAGVEVFAPSGMKLGTISGVNQATNAAFGGPERKTLYITGGDSLYSIELAIPGYPY
jgi:gluconolactonase